MKYWITHPNLTPEHDQQIEAGALRDWARSGWQIREDQADPDPAVALSADPRDHPVDEPAPGDVDTPEAPAADEPDTTITKKKGEV